MTISAQYLALMFVMPVLGHVLKHMPRHVLRHVLELVPVHMLEHVLKYVPDKHVLDRHVSEHVLARHMLQHELRLKQYNFAPEKKKKISEIL